MQEETREYSLATPLRLLLCMPLAMVLCVLGVTLATVALTDVPFHDPWTPEDQQFALGEAVVFVGITLIPALCALRWRVRIDERGVSRRLLLGWDTWTWEQLERGRIDKLAAGVLRDRWRPWWRRHLRLSLIADRHLDEALSLVNTRYRLPPARLPENPIVAFAVSGGGVIFDRDGVVVRRRRRRSSYAWGDVRRARFIVRDAVCQGFDRLRLTLPDGDIEIRRIHERADRGELRTLVQQHVPRDRLRVRLITPRRAVAERLRQWKDHERKGMVFLAWMVCGFLVMFLGLAVVTSDSTWAAMSAVFVLIWGLPIGGYIALATPRRVRAMRRALRTSQPGAVHDNQAQARLAQPA